MKIEGLEILSAELPRVSVTLRQDAAMVFQPDVHIGILAESADELLYSSDLSETFPIAWLPRGEFRLQCYLHDLDLPPGNFRLRMTMFTGQGEDRTEMDCKTVAWNNTGPVSAAGLAKAAWEVESAPGTAPIEDLAWNQEEDNWFFRHFDHAALIVKDYLLNNDPLLKGRILDVGCGDGIIDLGIFLRTQPEELVGIDPFGGFRRLPEIIADNHLPQDVLDDPRLKFLDEDGNAIPYPDDHFDVAISWGSLEHIAGGYEQTLKEIRRVLKKDGLLFVHPGLYYGALGNHLGEFFDDPYVHLKMPEEQLKAAVLGAEPDRMDRSGHIATSEEYWQWYTELNPISVSAFEQELRRLGFEPWRAAVRTSELVEYTPELQRYAIQDLATAELYLSLRNRK